MFETPIGRETDKHLYLHYIFIGFPAYAVSLPTAVVVAQDGYPLHQVVGGHGALTA
jgi:hypothetical protein